MLTFSWVLTGSGRKPIRFENQMKKKSVATNGNHLAAYSPDMFPDAMFVRVRLNMVSAAVCTRFGRCSMRRAIHVMVKIVSPLARTRYSTALLMLRSTEPILREIHGSSLNSFCGSKALFLPSFPNTTPMRIATAK